MTPKEKVLKRNSLAHCVYEPIGGKAIWNVYPRPFGQVRVWPMGTGKTAKEAWKDASLN